MSKFSTALQVETNKYMVFEGQRSSKVSTKTKNQSISKVFLQVVFFGKLKTAT